MGPEKNLEARIQEIAGAIYPFLKVEKPSFFASEGWRGKVVAWSMRDERFRTQLLRFIDVLPSLRTDELVLRIYREYLGEVKAGRSLLLRSAELFGRTVPAVIAAPLIRSAVSALARQFIVGWDPADGLPTVKRLWKDGVAVSVDLLGEAVVSEVEAGEHAGRHLELLELFGPAAAGEPRPAGAARPLDISLKLSSFYSLMDPLDFEGSVDTLAAALTPVLKKAGWAGASFTFDMEQYYHKDLVIATFKRVLSERGDGPLGSIALQAYLRDTRADLLELIRWARERRRKIGIRLVKGAYWDYEVVNSRLKGWPVPVFFSKDKTDANYEELTRVLLENADAVRPAIATHNVRSAANALALAEKLRLGSGDFEFQFLFGMGGPLLNAMKRAGLGPSARIYCPVGELLPGIAYLVRRVLENTSNDSFFRKTFGDGLSLDELARKPQPDRDVPEETPVPSGPGEFRNEPLTDFSKAPNRSAVRSSLTEVRELFGKSYPLVIDGQEVLTSAEALSTNPSRPDEIIGRIAQAGRSDADRAVEAARKAFPAWRATPPDERAEILLAAAGEMRKRRFELIALEVYEVGKTISEADGDVAEAVDHLEYHARRMRELGRPRRLGRLPGELNEYHYAPKGVAVIIAPWNFPLAISAGMTSAALVAGNCAILKPSGLAPVIARRLVDLFRTAGLPEGVLQYLPGPGGAVGEYLVAHPGIDLIAFTGSKEVGLGIVEKAGATRPGQRNVKRVVAEMGGKNAVVVDETADLDEAVRGVLESAFGYQGQKCSACSRAIVLDSVYELFTRRLSEAAKSIVIGPPEEFRTFLGPLIDKKALEKARRYIDFGKSEGKEVLVRAAKVEPGYFLGPALFEARPDAMIAREEIFGPLLTLIRARDFDEAVAFANDSEYALTGGVYSRSPANIEQAKREFQVGNLYINRKITGALVGRQPFGGFGMSGVGSKGGGPDYLLQFMNPRTVSENTMRKGSAPADEGILKRETP